MVLFNYSTKELTAKVVYYGPGLCGKTTNLQWIHEKTPIKNKGKMLSLATVAVRTIFFDFLPIDLGTIRGMKTRIQLYSVPGQVFYNATRRMVLKGADCVVFVADSQEPMLDANLDAVANLRENLEANEIDPDEIPTVLQYNKRDLPNALPVEILNEKLNTRGLTFFEAVAMKGQGVEETLKAATALVFKSLATKYGGGEAASGAARPAAAAPAPSASRPAVGPPTGTAPALRPAPAPAPVPVRQAPVPAPVPVMAAGSADELLESIDLSSSPEVLEEAPELSFDASPPADAFSGAQASSAGPRTPGKTTMVRNATETEDMRRRIGRPTEPELTLDAADEEEDIEEITFDGAASAAPSPSPPIPARSAPAVSRPPAPPTPAAAASRTIPPAPGRPAAASTTIPPAAGASPREDTAPIRLSATVASGESEVAVPVEVTVRQGTAEVRIQLRIVLQLKVV